MCRLNRPSLLFAIVALFIARSPSASHAAPVGDLTPTQLRCAGDVDPLGVDEQPPRLSWIVESSARGAKQTAYQILVATTQENLSEDQADLWNSGRVESSRTTHVDYAGQPLASSLQAFWKIRVWDRQGNPSPWSDAASWTMGVLKPEAWRGRWIVAPWSTESTLLRREFAVKPKLRRAVLHFCGLGQCELMLNGRKVGDRLLSPGWSKYDRTVLYESFDVTPLLHDGQNALGAVLGDGMYHTERRNRFSKFQGSFGPQRAIGQLELAYDDGAVEYVPTDEHWKVARGPVTYNDIYGGEDYDARLAPPNWSSAGFDDSPWNSAVLLVRPAGVLRGHAASAPPIVAIETRQPVATKTLSPTHEVVDLGQNASYMPRIRVAGPAGSTIRLTHAEVVNDDGTIDRSTCGGNRGGAWWQFTKSTDAEETWFPQFFYAGCRYLQVDMIPAKVGGELPKLLDLEGVVVHSTAPSVGKFECSNELFNRIHELARWAIRSNMMSILTDCPHREKLGWLEQYHLNGPSLRYEFDASRIFTKGMQDMADSQTADGLIPNIAPEYVKFEGTFRAAAEWGSSFILVPWQQYQFTGDDRLIRQHYDAMNKYMDYLASRCRDGILDEGLGDWYDVGPVKSGKAQLTPPEITATAIDYQDACAMAEMARLLTRNADAQRYARLAGKLRQSWRKKFRRDDGAFGTNSQTSNGLAGTLDLAEAADRPAALAALVKDLQDRGHAVTAGDVGYQYVLQALAQAGRHDVIAKMLSQNQAPGYAWQLDRGATSLTEAWNANRGASQNHFIFANIIQWFYEDLAGVRVDFSREEGEQIVIHPHLVDGVDWARGEYQSVRGLVACHWRRAGDKFVAQVKIPANCSARVTLPAPNHDKTPPVVLVERKQVEQIPQVKVIKASNTEEVSLIVESGDYEFTIAKQ